MSRTISLMVGILFVAGLTRAVGAGESGSKDTVPAQTASQRERELEELLKKPIEVAFEELSLTDAVEQLSLKVGTDIRIDQRALADAAIDSSVLITFKTPKAMPLGDALQLLLEDFELTPIIQYESLRVTSREKAEGIVTSRVYLVGDLVESRATGRPAMTAKYLIRVIKDQIMPGSWDVNGGIGTIIPSDMPGGPALLVTQTREAHQQLAALLADLRAGESTTPAGEADLVAALKQPATLEIFEQKIADVVQMIGKQQKAPITLDHKALADAAIDESVLVTLAIRKPVSLGAALDLLLDDLELTYVMQNGSIRITSKEKADGLIKQCVYPVNDLVQATTAQQASNGQLAESITESIMPDSWDVNRGIGALRFFYGAKGWLAVVSNTDRVQREVAELIASLRAARKTAAVAQTAAGVSAAPNPGAARTGKLPPREAPAAQPEPDDEDLKLERYQVNYIDAEQAKQAVTEMVSPRSWRAAGGVGAILVTKTTQRPTPGTKDQTPIESVWLVVRQTPQVHRAVRKLLFEIDKSPLHGMSGMWTGMGGAGSMEATP